MIKDFDNWNNIKKNIYYSEHKPPLFREREIWWCAFGVNVGSEVCGKNQYFRRPVLIIKKLSKTSFIGVPLSTKKNIGTWYATFTHSGGLENTANLSQIKYVDFKRLDKKIGVLDSNEFNLVKQQLKNLLDL